MNTTLDYLFRVEPPWIYVGCGEPERKKWNPSHFYSREGANVCVRRLRGKKMRTQGGLMDEFAASLQFFEGFGGNWDALGECLAYLDEWLPADAYVLVVEGAEEMLCDEQPEQMVALLTTLHESGEWWSKPVSDNARFNRAKIPFHVLLNVEEAEQSAIDRIVRIAVEAHVPVRR
jgi:hypothetical protein